ncbi:MAG TPA: NUDIX domain-containing protein [Patescibacteria group bacterium]|nr:NUDIX domain-containing protein [Patescibacteria group bacterium]
MKFEKLSSDIIRKHKGVSFPGVTTIFFCHDGNGKLFLAKRSKLSRDEHGRWDPGAGGLKHGQTVEDNMKRELKEEYNVEPISSEFIGYFDAFRINPDEQPSHWVAMCFAVQIDPGKVKMNEPGMFEDSGWFSLSNLPEPMHSQFEVFMNIHGEKLKEILNHQ